MDNSSDVDDDAPSASSIGVIPPSMQAAAAFLNRKPTTDRLKEGKEREFQL
jgi:hypothetical protein